MCEALSSVHSTTSETKVWKSCGFHWWLLMHCGKEDNLLLDLGKLEGKKPEGGNTHNPFHASVSHSTQYVYVRDNWLVSVNYQGIHPSTQIFTCKSCLSKYISKSICFDWNIISSDRDYRNCVHNFIPCTYCSS